jgi:osmotically-inducible protein OsmY
MKTKTTSLKLAALLALGAGGMLALSGGCAATATTESTGQYVDASAITAKVKAAFIRDDTIKAFDISVETFKDTVQLSGFVDTAAEKERAGTIAASIAGVREVENNITSK